MVSRGERVDWLLMGQTGHRECLRRLVNMVVWVFVTILHRAE